MELEELMLKLNTSLCQKKKHIKGIKTSCMWPQICLLKGKKGSFLKKGKIN